jgi:hypothetical protein
MGALISRCISTLTICCVAALSVATHSVFDALVQRYMSIDVGGTKQELCLLMDEGIKITRYDGNVNAKEVSHG